MRGQFIKRGTSPSILPTPTATLRQVVNRTFLNQTKSATSKYGRSKRGFRNNSGQTITQLQIVYANWYVAGFGSTLKNYLELGSGGSMLAAAGLEYPASTFTQVLFSGLATGTAADFTEITGIVNVSIPAGAIFWIHTRLDWASSNLLSYGNGSLAANPSPIVDSANWGDQSDSSVSSLTDITMTGVGYTNSALSGGATVGPLLVLGVASKPAILNIGTSISNGEGGAQPAGIGTSGEICEALDRDGFAYCNAGVRGDSVEKFIQSYSKRQAMAQYFQYIIFGGQTNDIGTGARTAVATNADSQTQYAMFPNQRKIQATMCPYAVGSSQGQTVHSTNPERVALRTLIMTGSQPLLYAKYDLGQTLESSLDSGVWDQTTPLTAGGVHPNATGYTRILNSGAVDTTILKPY